MSEPSRAVFLSYASQDAEAARRICEALRDYVKALLKANALSWKVGYAEPNP